MISNIGQFSLAAALLAGLAGLLASIAAGQSRSEQMLRTARWCVYAYALCIALASGALVAAFVGDAFQFEYVASYSERALPTGYKLAAFWAGQEGSLLLWALMLGGLSAGAAFAMRSWKNLEGAGMLGTLATVCGFFAALLLFAANPFQMFPQVAPPDGNGLNPALQNPGMVFHPPLLFMGYAGFAVPFAAAIGILISGRTDAKWLAPVRPWILTAWLFLTAGIVLGAWWAYVELGWGGYWAWDPVENASLMPWLSSTALVHSIMVQQHRGMFKRWNMSLITTTFVMCVFGTYITRSGVIQSVHAFPESAIGQFFLFFLLTLILGSAAFILWRFHRLRPDHQLDGLISREGAFLLGNVLLMIMMITTLIGTTFPLLSGQFTEEPISVGPPFYNKVVAPMAVLVVGVMALGPILVFGKTAAAKIARNLTLPGSGASLVCVAVFLFGVHSVWALVCVFLAALGTFTVIHNFIFSVSARHRSTGENWIASAFRLVDMNHRRYGGQLVHLGAMMLVIGVVGSSVYNNGHILQMKKGETQQVGDFTATLVDFKEVRGPNYSAAQADVVISDSNGKQVASLSPQKRLYDKWQDEFNTEIALQSTLTQDLYVALAGWEANGTMVAVRVDYKPLVLWIWIGGIVMVLGSVFCVMPQLLGRPDRVRATEERTSRSSADSRPKLVTAHRSSLQTEVSP